MKKMATLAPTTGPNEKQVYDVVVVGGGLSGVIISHEIHQQHIRWKLFEASTRVGGRIKNDDDVNQIDLGGAWIWPRLQPNISKLVASSSLETFLQPDDPSSTRIVGGAIQLVDHLVEKLPKDCIQLNTPIKSCRLSQSQQNSGNANDDFETRENLVCLETAERQDKIYSRRVIFAVPPKLLSMHVAFDPPLSREKQVAMNESQTWMAGVTKVALVYEEPFWKKFQNASNMGLPTNIGGPAFQVYDGSAHDNSTSALTFFTLVPHDSAAVQNDRALADQCASQIQQIWSELRLPQLAEKAKLYTTYYIQRWPKERYISEDSKPQRVNPHPSPSPALSNSEWNGALLFAGSESSTSDPGVMEGAVQSACRVVQDLKDDVLL